MASTLDRIRELLAESHGHDWAYQPNPCLSKAHLAAWEAEHGITLPDEYRTFLREIGDGGEMPGSYCAFVLGSLSDVKGMATAGEPFPVTAERVRLRFEELGIKEKPLPGVALVHSPLPPGARLEPPRYLLFPELDIERDEDGEWEPAPGCLHIGAYPSSDPLFLVTAGDLRGSVWNNLGDTRPETDATGQLVGFLAWFADVLTEFKGGA